MGANTIQVPLLCQKCKRRDSNTRIVSGTPDNVRLVNKTRHMSLPLLVQLFFLQCSVWMVCCCRRASCSGVTSLQSAELRRTDSTQRESWWLLSTAAGHWGRHRPSQHCTWSLSSITKRTLYVSSKYTSPKTQTSCWYEFYFLYWTDSHTLLMSREEILPTWLLVKFSSRLETCFGFTDYSCTNVDS